MSEQPQARSRDREFVVTFTGIQLPDDFAAGIDKEIHKAVLLHLAELDVATGYAVRFVRTHAADAVLGDIDVLDGADPGGGGGGTQGMHIIADAE